MELGLPFWFSSPIWTRLRITVAKSLVAQLAKRFMSEALFGWHEIGGKEKKFKWT